MATPQFRSIGQSNFSSSNNLRRQATALLTQALGGAGTTVNNLADAKVANTTNDVLDQYAQAKTTEEFNDPAFQQEIANTIASQKGWLDRDVIREYAEKRPTTLAEQEQQKAAMEAFKGEQKDIGLLTKIQSKLLAGEDPREEASQLSSKTGLNMFQKMATDAKDLQTKQEELANNKAYRNSVLGLQERRFQNTKYKDDIKNLEARIEKGTAPAVYNAQGGKIRESELSEDAQKATQELEALRRNFTNSQRISQARQQFVYGDNNNGLDPTDLRSITHDSETKGRYDVAVPDSGGTVSMGAGQLNSRNLPEFFKQEGKDFKEILNGKSGQSLINAYKNMTPQQQQEFSSKADQWVERTLYQPVRRVANGLGVIDDPQVNQILYSVGTQHGAGGARRILKNALGSGIDKNDPKQVIQAIQGERARRFPAYSSRYGKEFMQATSMLKNRDPVDRLTQGLQPTSLTTQEDTSEEASNRFQGLINSNTLNTAKQVMPEDVFERVSQRLNTANEVIENPNSSNTAVQKAVDFITKTNKELEVSNAKEINQARKLAEKNTLAADERTSALIQSFGDIGNSSIAIERALKSNDATEEDAKPISQLYTALSTGELTSDLAKSLGLPQESTQEILNQVKGFKESFGDSERFNAFVKGALLKAYTDTKGESDDTFYKGKTKYKSSRSGRGDLGKIKSTWNKKFNNADSVKISEAILRQTLVNIREALRESL